MLIGQCLLVAFINLVVTIQVLAANNIAKDKKIIGGNITATLGGKLTTVTNGQNKAFSK